MKRRFLFFILACPLIFIFICGATFRNVLRQHYYKPHNKAIFLAQDSRRVWTYGESSGLLTEEEAIEKASASCEQSRAQAGVKSPCTLYSVNGQVVHGRNYTPRAEPRAPGKAPEQTTPRAAYGTGSAIN
jgi:hypothetical protein